MSQPKVFISYRRSDSLDQTGRLYDRLNRAFPGMFFRDVSGIGVGVDFVKQIERAVGASVSLIAVIGPTWATAADEHGRRLDDPGDFVRVEVQAALKRNIRIIPVLVGGAAMVTEDQLPDDLRPLTRWNAIRIVEDYYDEGIEKLVKGLVSDLGDPVADAAGQQTDARIKTLRGEAEAAIGVEDWFGAVQALQAALSLEPGNFEVSARLKWTNEQRKLSGLFAEAQDHYEHGRKAAALVKFRQVKVAGGDYRGVNDLIAQLDREVASESRRSTVKRWTAGAIAAVVGVVALIGVLVVMQIRSEFAGVSDFGGAANASADTLAPSGAATGSSAGAPGPAEVPPSPASRSTAPPDSTDSADDRAFAQAPQAGTGFRPIGRFRAVNHENQAMTFTLMLNPNATFQVQAGAGMYNVPLSGGAFVYDPQSGIMVLSGVNNVSGFFSEPVHVYERHDGHFHAVYAGVRWDLFPDQ